MIANMEKPAWVSWYKANKNRRKSNSTLPLFSVLKLEMLIGITLFCVTVFDSGQAHLRYTVYKVVEPCIRR